MCKGRVEFSGTYRQFLNLDDGLLDYTKEDEETDWNFKRTKQQVVNEVSVLSSIQGFRDRHCRPGKIDHLRTLWRPYYRAILAIRRPLKPGARVNLPLLSPSLHGSTGSIRRTSLLKYAHHRERRRTTTRNYHSMKNYHLKSTLKVSVSCSLFESSSQKIL